MMFLPVLLSVLLSVDVIVAQATDCTVCPDGVTPPPDMAKPLPADLADSFFESGIEGTCGGMGEFLVLIAATSDDDAVLASSCAELQNRFVTDSAYDYGAYCDCSGTEEFVPACGGTFCESGAMISVAPDVIAFTDEDGVTATCGVAEVYYQFNLDDTICADFEEPKTVCCGGSGATNVTLIPDTDFAPEATQAPDTGVAADTQSPVGTQEPSSGHALSLAFAASVMLLSVIL